MYANLKLAVRSLTKSPFVSAIAIISLALGIGANAAIFSLYNDMLLQPLPVPHPDGLVSLAAPGEKPGSTSCNNAGGCDVVFSYPMFRDLEDLQTVFTGMAAHRSFSANLAFGGETLSSQGMLVSGGYFPVLGLQPAIGRLIGPADDLIAGESAVVVLSHSYWQARFGADPAVVNQTLVVNGQPLTIIGVAPPEFEGTTLGTMPRVFVPITLRGMMETFSGDSLENRRAYWAYVFARLAPGVEMEQALAVLNPQYSVILEEVEVPLQDGVSEQSLERFRAKELSMEDGRRGQSSMQREAGAPLLLLNAVTGLVLLIACANIANLLLGRAAARAGEMAVRLAVGASRTQLLSQLLTESLVLAACGGLVGLLVARWTLSMIASLMPEQVAQMVDPSLDPTVVMFTTATVLGAGVLFGSFPALISMRTDVLSVMKGQGGRSGGGRLASWFRAVLTTGQIALSMTLLILAGLFVRSLDNISRVDLGLDENNLITFGISPALNAYEPAASKDLFARTEDALSAVPGVTDVTASMVPILAGNNWGQNVSVEGFEADLDTDTNSRFNAVGPAYFRTLGIPLMSGREFTRADTLDAPKVAIVNEEFARKFDLGRDAVGKRMQLGRGNDLDIEIIGLAQNAKYNDVKDEIPPLFFLPYRQMEDIGAITFYARTALDAEQLLPSVAPLVSRLDANLPVENVRTMQMQIEENTFGDRIISTLSAAFAVLATLLAAVGLYGVLAYTVAQRTREIGLRVALGAEPARVRGLILRQMAVMTFIGGLVGLAAALALGRAAQSLLYEVTGYDPLTLVASVVLLSVIALGAGAIPAHRASRVDPLLALRAD